MGEICSAGDFCRLQSDVLSTVFAWLHGDAAKVLRVPRRVSGIERDVVGGCIDSGGRILDSDGLFLLVDALRASCNEESVGRVLARVDDVVAPAYGKLQGDSGRDVGSVRIPPHPRSRGH